jgi:hypothetical protein
LHSSLISKLFATLEHWKKLPAYKAEPRVDWLVGAYLDQILAKFLGTPIASVIPEFPIRIGTIYPEQESTMYAERSYKVDFYVQLKNGQNVLVEFKTDSASRRDKQDHYLEASQQAGMVKLVDGVCRIAKVSPYKKKYNYLLSCLGDLGLVETQDKVAQQTVQFDPIQIIYIQPRVLDTSASNEISFDFVADVIGANPDEFSQRLAQSLRVWSVD